MVVGMIGNVCSSRDNRFKGDKYELIVEVRDKHGKLISRKSHKMDSFLANYWDIVRVGLVTATTPFLLKDTDGNSHNITSIDFSNSKGANADQNDDSFGIVVGSGSTQVDIQNDYNLANKISNGTGSGQLQYGSTSFTDDFTQLPKMILEVKRSFINNSGGDITVNEIGLVLQLSTNDGTINAMIIRDVITATTVPNGGTLNVTYKLSVN